MVANLITWAGARAPACMNIFLLAATGRMKPEGRGYIRCEKYLFWCFAFIHYRYSPLLTLFKFYTYVRVCREHLALCSNAYY